jgi:hypothetical protein
MSEGPGRYAAPQVRAHLREDPDRGGLVVQVHIDHSNWAGAPYERHVPDLDEALGYVGAFWQHSAPGRDAAVPAADGIEWGYRYRLLRRTSDGHRGRQKEVTAGSREDAEAQVAEFLEDGGKWEAEVIWRTAKVEPGEWHSLKLTVTDAIEKAAGSIEDGEAVTPQVLSDLMPLAGGTVIPPEVIATWTDGEREQAASWASAEHLSASDHPVIRVPQPEVVRRAAEICASPALAQLAVESWRDAGNRLEQSGFTFDDESAHALAVAGQDAITGLLVLLRTAGQPGQFSSEQMAATYRAGYVKARQDAATEEPL